MSVHPSARLSECMSEHLVTWRWLWFAVRRRRRRTVARLKHPRKLEFGWPRMTALKELVSVCSRTSEREQFACAQACTESVCMHVVQSTDPRGAGFGSLVFSQVVEQLKQQVVTEIMISVCPRG